MGDMKAVYKDTMETSKLNDHAMSLIENGYNSSYSASKASSDLLVRAWNKTYGIKSVITNCSNNYGPWQNPEKLIPKTIMNALTKNKIPIYGRGINRWLWRRLKCRRN